MSERPRLGPFELLAPLARGGMGEVWEAVHVAQDQRLAIKVMTESAAREDRYRAFFRNEVRAVAGLDHPGIIIVYDHGEVSAEAAALSDRLVEGSPWLAMELATGGSLSKRKKAPEWPELRAILMTLLDALAHAHARGVVHRDLKPGNVLYCDDGRLKITDFGIAKAIDPSGTATYGRKSATVGTPEYMAPEQLIGDSRDLGPWTDLYALGCMAWRLTAGKLPFDGLSGPALLRAQLMDDPPELVPIRPMPADFPQWVEMLLHKDRRDRFQRASDAAWALQSLGDPVEGGTADPDTSPELSTVDFTTFSLSATLDDLPALQQPKVVYRPQRRNWPRPPMVRTWRHRRRPDPPMNLLGAGLGLYGLRSVRLVGRENERDALWGSLYQVWSTGSSRAVFVHGAAGTGKSRLVQWIAERAHETGAATIVKGLHAEQDGPAEALSRTIRRFLKCSRLDRVRVRERVGDFFGQDEGEGVEPLTELVCPAPDGEEGVVRLEQPGQRYEVIRQLLLHLGQERPVIFWLDDVHYGLDSLGLVEHVLTHDERPPVLFVLCARDDAVSERPEEAAMIRSILGRPVTRRVALGALKPTERSRLVRELLGLEETLAAQVEERTGGNPLFAVQLVGDWVARDLLLPGPHGFTLRAGSSLQLPDSMHEVWAGRIDAMVTGLPDNARGMLELAAVLGQEVDEEEWQEAADIELGREKSGRYAFDRSGARTRAMLTDRLLEGRLAVETELGFTFTHGMLRESLLRSARETGRYEQHHRACARMLQALEPPHPDGLAERVGRHLVAAGELDAALDPLLQGVGERKLAVGYRDALSLLGVCEEVAKAMRLAITDPRWGRLWVSRAALYRLAREGDFGAQWADRAISVARTQQGWDDVLVDALIERAQAAVVLGDVPQARELLDEAKQNARDPLRQGRALQNMAAIALLEHERGLARALLHDARDHYESVGEEFGVAECLRIMATGAPPTEAHNYLQKAQAVYERLGIRTGVAHCRNGRGDLFRRSEEYPEAERELRAALELFLSMGGGQAVLPRLNLALLFLGTRRFDEARRQAELARITLERGKAVHLLAGTHVTLLAATAGLQEWEAFDTHLRRTRELLAASEWHDRDVAFAAREAGELAANHGEFDRARGAYEIALADYTARGRHISRVEVQTVLDNMPTDADAHS